MVGNARRAEIYGAAADRIERGWGKGAVKAGPNACLAGAINYATVGDERFMEYESITIQTEIATRLFDRNFAVRWVMDKSLRQAIAVANDRRGLCGIEFWNDAPWRRRGQVVRLLRELEAEYKEKARVDHVAALEAEVVRLRTDLERAKRRITELEREVARLREEAGWWKKRALERTEREMFGTVAEMQSLADELEQTRQCLADVG